MNNQITAYQTASRSIETARQTDAFVLMKAALMLTDAKNGKADVDVAIRFSQTVWAVILTEITKDTNTLPIEVKQNLLNLGNFVMKRIIEFQFSRDMAKLDAIINVNKQISMGLSEGG